MRIELASLEASDGKYSQTYEPGQLIIDDRVRLSGSLTVIGRVTRSKGKVVITGAFDSHVHVDCDRCLKDVQLAVKTQFEVEYVTSQAYEAMQVVELSETDMALSVFDGEAIDLDDLVREQLLLALPSRILCQETCKGLCPVCGIDRNLA